MKKITMIDLTQRIDYILDYAINVKAEFEWLFKIFNPLHQGQ